MKVQAKIVSSERVAGAFRFHLHFDGPAEALPPQQYVDIEIPDPEPVKSDGQKAYEAHTPVIPWADLAVHYRNQFHVTAAAVTGKPPVIEKEPAPVSAGERFFLAFLNGGAYRYNWRTMSGRERAQWAERACNYEASK